MVRISTKFNTLKLPLFLNAQAKIKQNSETYLLPKCGDRYMGLTNSSYLHYGYWEPLPTQGEELTLTRLRVTQVAYTAKLLSFIPEGIKALLDVGCGIGGTK
jgi:hypothetical protein